MANCKVQKVETQLKINVSAEKFYEIFCNRTHQVAKICPEMVKSVEIHKGEWGSEGSIICWIIHDGKVSVSKEVIESIDQKNNKVRYKVLDQGEYVMKHYKNFYWILQVTPQEKGGSIVHWTFEYEKQSEQVPEPHSLLQFAVKITKDIDAHLTQF